MKKVAKKTLKKKTVKSKSTKIRRLVDYRDKKQFDTLHHAAASNNMRFKPYIESLFAAAEMAFDKKQQRLF